MCSHRIDDSATGLCCTLPDHPDTPHGHCYVASAGPDLGGDE